MHPYLPLSDNKRDEPPKADLISGLAALGLPALILFLLLAHGWSAFLLLGLLCAIIAIVYWRLGFFHDTDDQPD